MDAYAGRAGAQLAALTPEQMQGKITKWRDLHGQRRADGTLDLEFNAVRERMTIRLGGLEADGPSEFTLDDL